MATKGKSKGKKASKAKTAKPRAAKVVEIPANVTQAVSKALKDESLSNCEAIRQVAKRLGSVRRIVLEQAFVKAGMKVGTVRRQIQEGRAA